MGRVIKGHKELWGMGIPIISIVMSIVMASQVHTHHTLNTAWIDLFYFCKTPPKKLLKHTAVKKKEYTFNLQ